MASIAPWKNNVGMHYLYIIFLLILLALLAFNMTGGFLPHDTYPSGPDAESSKYIFDPVTGKRVEDPERLKVINSTGGLNTKSKQEFVFPKKDGKNNLQLYTFDLIETCEATIAIQFLIDVSGSMRENDSKGFSKIAKEKSALTSFLNKMSDTSLVGIRTFNNNQRNDVTMDLFKTVGDKAKSVVSNIRPNGFTHTRSAFQAVKGDLEKAKADPRFSNYKFNLVFLSDGVPETSNPGECITRSGSRCFAKIQDPRVPTNIPQEIKDLGIDIYSIAITSSKDKAFETDLLLLLKDTSSDPDDKYFANSVDGNNLTPILNGIFENICGTPTAP